jgi:hypothetical protein
MIAMIGRAQLHEAAAIAIFAGLIILFVAQVVPALVD